MTVVGFMGLGDMGSVLAANLVAAGHEVVTYDIAGPERSPVGAEFVDDVARVAGRTDVVVLSLPNGGACEQVARAIAGAAHRRVCHIVDTSTVGVDTAWVVTGVLTTAGIG
jgi:3-hydroxyisobutyrate dehydrogenase